MAPDTKPVWGPTQPHERHHAKRRGVQHRRRPLRDSPTGIRHTAWPARAGHSASTLQPTEPAQLPGGPRRPSWLRSQIQRPLEQRWKTNCMTSRTRHACTHSQLHGDASPERSGEASSHGSGQRPAKDAPGGASVHHRPCHTSVTNHADATGPQSPDLLQRTHHGLAWTPMDGLYNLCHVVPSEGPKIRTGASSGPSKRYCSVLILVSLTGSHLYLSRSVTRPPRDLPMPPLLEAGPPRPASRTTSWSSSRSSARPTWQAGDPAPRCSPGRSSTTPEHRTDGPFEGRFRP